MVAYLVHETDPDIKSPSARCMIYPVVNTERDVAFMVGEVYGAETRDFRPAARAIVNAFNKTKPDGRYLALDQRGYYGSGLRFKNKGGVVDFATIWENAEYNR